MTAASGLRLLVVAKAPVPGLTKTRLARVIGELAAAEVAAAALMDTLATCTSTFGAAHCHLSLTGDLADGVAASELVELTRGWSVRGQRGATFAERLVNAHADLEGPRVQIGMDTPQVRSEHLVATGLLLDEHDAVLGPAHDGGWWALAATTAAPARPLVEVAMSTPSTLRDTHAALTSRGWRVARSVSLRDVDEIDDLEPVAQAAGPGHFRDAVHGLRHELGSSAGASR